MDTTAITYLDQKASQQVDEELMNEMGYSMEFMMELAGLSVAQAVYDANLKYHQGKVHRVLVISGPGNNGGDGYVAARHLKLLGFNPKVMIVKQAEKPLYKMFIKSCESNDIEIIDYNKSEAYKTSFISTVESSYDLVLDAIFGYSFSGPIRKPYDEILENFKTIKTPVFSVDIPSGWDVEKGNSSGLFTPEYVISLTLPKLGMKDYKGKHYLGCRFIPQKMIEKHSWKLPEYKGLNHFIDLTNL